jgi:hypothetical protein
MTKNKKEDQITLTDLGVLKPGRGGRRSGAGRKPDGVTLKVSITIPLEEWEYIDQHIIGQGHASSRSEYFRRLHLAQRGK